MGRFRDVLDVAMGRRAAGPPMPSTAAALRDGITVSSAGSFRLDLDAEARGWHHSAVAYRCVLAIADNASSVDLGVYDPDGTRLTGHWADVLFNLAPNPDMSAKVFKSVVFQQLELSGQAFAFLDLGDALAPSAVPLGVYPLYERVEVIVGARPDDTPRPAAVIGYVLHRDDGIRVPMLPDEVLWLRYPHPFRPMEAMAPWKAARFAVDQDAFAREWQRSSFENGAQPGGVVYLGELEPGEFAAAKASFRSTVEGARNARKHLLVASRPGGTGKGIQYERLGFTAAEVDYLETRMANAQEVMLAFGVPRDMLQGGATYENQSQAKTNLWSDTILPKLEIVASEVDRALLPSLEEQARFDLTGVEALQEAQESVIARTIDMVDRDLLFLDEARANAGWEPMPGNAGKMTLTAYRAQFAPAPVGAAEPASADRSAEVAHLVRAAVQEALAPLAAVLAPPAPAPALERATPAPPAATAPAAPGAHAELHAAYDELEAEGRAAVRRLAREQQQVVLRDFDRLMAKPNRSAEWLAGVQREARAMATAGLVTTGLPDPAQVPALAMTGLRIAMPSPDWEQRIRIGDLFDGEYWRRRTADALRPFLARVWRRGGASVPGQTTDDPGVSAELAARLDDLAGKVTATTEQVIRSQILAAGVAAGESIPELRARLQRVFADLSDYRAAMIARTETVGGYSAAALRSAVAAGAVTKTWMATDDARTRATHRAASGSLAPIEGRFALTQSRFPADPQAPANQSINCRCALTFGFTPTTTED